MQWVLKWEVVTCIILIILPLSEEGTCIDRYPGLNTQKGRIPLSSCEFLEFFDQRLRA